MKSRNPPRHPIAGTGEGAALSQKSIEALRWAALSNDERVLYSHLGEIPYEEDLAEGFLPLKSLGFIQYDLYTNPKNLPRWEDIVLSRYGTTSTPGKAPGADRGIPVGTIVASGGGGVIVTVSLTEAGQKEAKKYSAKIESEAN